MKTIYAKYPNFCNIDTGLCVVPVQFLEPIEAKKDIDLPNECL